MTRSDTLEDKRLLSVQEMCSCWTVARFKRVLCGPLSGWEAERSS